MSFDNSIESSFKSSSTQFNSERSDESDKSELTPLSNALESFFDGNYFINELRKEHLHSENFQANTILGLNQNNKRVLEVFNENIQKISFTDIEATQPKKKKLSSEDKKKMNFLSFWSRVREKFPQQLRSSIPKNNISDILEWIKENSSELEKMHSLNLRGLDLTEIPSEIKYLKSLCTLDASLNKITNIPEEVYNLTKLEILSLEDNRLGELSSSIKKLTQLEEFILTGNVLENLPDEIENLANLRILKLGDNYIEEMPKSLEGLGNLRELFLDNNQFKNVPPSLVELTSLEVLNLKNNHISIFPSTLNELNGLIFLDISDNKLESNQNFKIELIKLHSSLKNLQSFNY